MDCTAEHSVCACLRCSGIGKSLRSAPELHPEVVYESSCTCFHHQSDRAGSLAGHYLNLRLELGLNWQLGFSHLQSSADSPLSFAKHFVLSKGKLKVGVNGDDDLSEMFCRHILISVVRAGSLQKAVRDAV